MQHQVLCFGSRFDASDQDSFVLLFWLQNNCVSSLFAFDLSVCANMTHSPVSGMFGAFMQDMSNHVGAGLAAAGAGASGMVAEHRSGHGAKTGIRSDFYGELSHAFSRSCTPPANPQPPYRHRVRDGTVRSTSPRRSGPGGGPPNPLRYNMHQNDVEDY